MYKFIQNALRVYLIRKIRSINQTSWRIHHNSDTTILPFQKKISHMAVKAFFPPPEDPAGMTFKTLNLTVFDKGLKN